jgi:oxygen-dependent protoporphyrinogen oxidase
MFVAPRGGMKSLIESVVAKLPKGTLRLNSAVTRIVRGPAENWQLSIRTSGHNEPLPSETASFDGVIVATPAYRAARLLENVDGELATLLDQIPYAGTSLVSLVYRRADIGHPLDGFGFVVPAVEQRQILAASFASNKFPDRVADDEVLIRVFIGGACQPELADAADDRLRSIAVTELAELLQILAEPRLVQINRWPRSMPQYHVGHLNLVDQVDARVQSLPGLALAGSAYRGVGIPHCIHSGEQAAERLSARNQSLS